MWGLRMVGLLWYTCTRVHCIVDFGAELFITDIRDQLKPQNLSFADVAKSVGERWKILDQDTRARYEGAATLAKEEYNRELAAYKQTDQFAAHQKYLVEFKSKSNKGSSGKLDYGYNHKFLNMICGIIT